MKKNRKCDCGIDDSPIHIRCLKSKRTKSFCIACFEEVIISGDYNLVDMYANMWKVIDEEELDNEK
jgi:hypothetical protein